MLWCTIDPIWAPTCLVELRSPGIRRVVVSSDPSPNTPRGYREPCYRTSCILGPEDTLALGIHHFSKFHLAAVFCDCWPFRFAVLFGAICGSALYSRRSVTVGRRAGRSLYSGVCISIFCQCLLYWSFFCVIFSSSLLFIYWGWSSTAFTSTVFGFYPVAVLCSRLHLSR